MRKDGNFLCVLEEIGFVGGWGVGEQEDVQWRVEEFFGVVGTVFLLEGVENCDCWGCWSWLLFVFLVVRESGSLYLCVILILHRFLNSLEHQRIAHEMDFLSWILFSVLLFNEKLFINLNKTCLNFPLELGYF